MGNMELKSSPKIFDNYKCDYPENTIKQIKSGLEKLGLKPIYKQNIIQSEGYSIYSGDLIIEDFGFSTFGKNTSPILAKASSYAEMVERISAAFTTFYNLNFNIEKYTEILKDVIDRKFLPSFTITGDHDEISHEKINQYFQKEISFKQYNLLKENNILNTLVNSCSLVTQTYSKIPVQFIDMISGSNGLAAGNTMEEAIIQGSCEIFERFSASEIVSKEKICPTIDIKTIKDDRIQNYIKMLNSLNFEVLIKDFTLNNKLPVIGVLFINHNIENDTNIMKKDRYYKLIDVGSHIDLKEAIIRCFIERLQELTKEELMFRKESDKIYDFWTKTLKKKYVKTKDIFKYFFRDYYYYGDISFLEKGDIISFDDLKSISNHDSLDDLKHIIEICKNNNWDLKVIDYTHKTLNFPTVRVIIPPLSSDSNPYVQSFLSFDSLEDQFNFFYGIKDLYRYVYSDDWLDDNDSIKKLIQNMEDALSIDLFSFELVIRRGPFYQASNLFHILAFANLSIGNNFEALKYLEFLHNHKFDKDLKSKYFNTLYNPNFDSNIYEKYINLIKEKLSVTSYPPLFRFKSNPFQPEKDLTFLDKKMEPLMKRFVKGYF